ncbi:MAG: hypothetical protein KGZ40_07015 [Clostridiales bacterium]|nr:hypothetical protein [Clostridiales bacterium]
MQRATRRPAGRRKVVESVADPQKERQQYALQTIFSFFLGLMVLAFIGIGVNTFYPQPEQWDTPEMRELQNEQDQIYRVTKGELSPQDERRLGEIQEEMRVLTDQTEANRQLWARNTSIVLILFATMVMGVSLVRSDQLRVISNGLLLGGLFTMVYGVGWIIFSGESVARFAVIVFALLVTLALGYLRFVHGKTSNGTGVPVFSGSPAAITMGDSDAALVLARIEILEARVDAAAEALIGRRL